MHSNIQSALYVHFWMPFTVQCKLYCKSSCIMHGCVIYQRGIHKPKIHQPNIDTYRELTTNTTSPKDWS